MYDKIGITGTLKISVAVTVLLLTGACGSSPQQPGSAASPTTNPPAASVTSPPTASPAPAAMSWPEPPAMVIDEDKAYHAIVETTAGSFTIELFAAEAPLAVNNFVFLAREGFYDDIIFHRIVETFMIQTGDPLGNGTGGPGYRFEHEPTDYLYEVGIVAMANSGPDTNGSQFFIVTGDASHLNPNPVYTVFGQISEGMDTVRSIAATPVTRNPRNGQLELPLEEVAMNSITIIEETNE